MAGEALAFGSGIGNGEATFAEEVAQMVRVAGSARDHVRDALQPVDQALRLRAVAPVTRSYRDPERKTKRIDGNMDLRRQAAFRASDPGSLKRPHMMN